MIIESMAVDEITKRTIYRRRKQGTEDTFGGYSLLVDGT